MKEQTFQFPVIQILNDNLIYGIRDIKRLKKASLNLINVFNNSLILDSSGKLFKVNEAFMVGWGTPFWGYHPFLKGRQIKIDFVITKVESTSIESLKELLLSYLNKRYPKSFYFFATKEELKHRIQESKSIKEIIELFIDDLL